MQGIEYSTVFAGNHQQTPFYSAGQLVIAEQAFVDILHTRATPLLRFSQVFMTVDRYCIMATGVSQGCGLERTRQQGFRSGISYVSGFYLLDFPTEPDT